MESTKKELVIVNGALEGHTYHDVSTHVAIKDPVLKKCVVDYSKCEGRLFADAWRGVKLIGEMTEHIKKDFGSDAAFARYMGKSVSAINKARRLAKYADKCIEIGMSASNAYELLAMKDTDKAFAALTADDATLTQKQLRAVVKRANGKDTPKKKSDKTPETLAEIANQINEETENINELDDVERGYIFPVSFDRAKHNVIEVSVNTSELTDEQMKQFCSLINTWLKDFKIPHKNF